MEHREEVIRLWFSMWLRNQDLGMDRIFAADAVYTESWGPQYQGLERIRHWFREWNTRGRVVVWDIREFFHKGDKTVVLWYFRNEMADGRVEEFDGLSLVRWTEDDRICSLQEFGCNPRHYDPYGPDGSPRFRDEPARWF